MIVTMLLREVRILQMKIKVHILIIYVYVYVQIYLLMLFTYGIYSFTTILIGSFLFLPFRP